ncbi:MAG: DOPA 4,5-dioxygenase family protein [Pseudomonadota bacterium]
MSQEYHAHVYFDALTIEQARELCLAANENFELRMGRVHEKPVGPHPMWSCQMAFAHDVFADLVSWLALNRDGLIIFIHPETGDVIADHTNHAIWMGEVMPLELDALR